MALTKPILNSVTAWDTADGYKFTFSVVGGSQVIGNTLTIRNNSTNTTVYTNTVTSFALNNTVPANAIGLTNGTYYNAYITTTDADGNTSVASNTVQFYCYTTPELTFTNVTEGGSVANATFNATISYDQDENETINSYSINLYDASQILSQTSGIVYVSNVTTLPATFSYLFSGLEDNTIYYVSATCDTVNGATATTGLVKFTTIYDMYDIFTGFVVNNNCDEGYISITSNSVLVEGNAYPDPPTYIDDEYVDLTDDGSYVVWDDGYIIYNDFTAKFWFKNPNTNAPLVTLTNENGDNIIIRMMVDYDTDTYVFATLDVTNGYSIYTPSIAMTLSDEEYCIQFRRIGQLYSIDLEVITT